ncbi:MAG: methylenetetrahydrofolate reductase [Treponema sp.]|jgi:methylenetetrahydrofolate reductase (NADPH)|nr:methylenetetrahydrofolate reductase [Treponema sp.]
MAVDISLEIVPRGAASIIEDMNTCARYPGITLINVPDLVRFTLRSWEACGILLREQSLSGLRGIVPHLRARDFSPDEPFPLTGFFREHRITKALVITGDRKDGTGGSGEGSGPGGNSGGELRLSVPFIKKLKFEMPELEIYAAFDPYRTNIRYELDYLALKEEAGASGFMSQPFFDLRLLEIYSEYLENKRIFWGITPVLSSGSRGYWESRNRTIFPKSFRADMFWNINFGRQVLDFCGKNNFSVYLMPVRVDLAEYLSGLFTSSR